MARSEPSPGAKLAARIIDALLDAGLLDARFEDEALRVVSQEIETFGEVPRGKDGPHDRTA
jgi:hypothetical protein